MPMLGGSATRAQFASANPRFRQRVATQRLPRRQWKGQLVKGAETPSPPDGRRRRFVNPISG